MQTEREGRREKQRERARVLEGRRMSEREREGPNKNRPKRSKLFNYSTYR